MAYRRCEDCVSEEKCSVRRVFASVHEATTQILDNMTLSAALAGEGAAPVRELLRSAG
jgi:DNA-binding IscR family transcriptional regulator